MNSYLWLIVTGHVGLNLINHFKICDLLDQVAGGTRYSHTTSVPPLTELYHDTESCNRLEQLYNSTLPSLTCHLVKDIKMCKTGNYPDHSLYYYGQTNVVYKNKNLID